MSRLILFNKPFGVLSQFTDVKSPTPRPTLSDFITIPGVYPAGRLDQDSEGLLLLTDDGALQARISNPRHMTPKTYWAQVEGEASPEQISQLAKGVALKDGLSLPAKACAIDTPDLWPRNPPIRVRQSIPDCWIEITITEGRNRQVRRMTAAVGLPTLRLVRVKIGEWQLGELKPGEWKEV